MNEKKIIEAMARLDGWTSLRFVNQWPFKPYFVGIRDRGYVEIVPNYLEDHNAVQRVINRLDGLTLFEYSGELVEMWGCAWESHFSSPAQKCEAILKAKGLWEDYTNGVTQEA